MALATRCGLARRRVQGAGFEGGLTLLLLPVMAFFFICAIGYTWAFDKVFGLPQSAAAR